VLEAPPSWSFLQIPSGKARAGLSRRCKPISRLFYAKGLVPGVSVRALESQAAEAAVSYLKEKLENAN
jgi:hypothetical protein